MTTATAGPPDVRRRKRRRVAPAARTAAAALLLLLPVPGSAQEMPTVEPGQVATVPVSAPAPTDPAVERMEYAVEEVSGVRLFGAAEGRVRPEDGRVTLGLTFQVEKDLRAGTHRIARVVLAAPDGRRDTVAVEVRVPARYGLEATFVVGSATIGAGGEVEVGYRVANRGNARDTVRLEFEEDGDSGWRFLPRRSRLVMDPGRTDTVAVHVRAPTDVRVGEIQRVRLLASGRGARAAGHITFHVVERGGWVPGVEHVPGRIFVGSSTAGTPGASPGIVASFQAGGSVGDGTDVHLEGHHRPDRFGTPRPLRREVLGPGIRLSVERTDWSASAGDVFARTHPLAGSFLAGRGAAFRWDGEESYAELFLADPATGPGSDGGGHSFAAAGGLELEDGRVGLVASDQRSPGGLGPTGGRTQSLGGRLELGSRSDRFVRVEVGALRLSPESGPARLGPAAEGELWLSGDDGFLTVRGRTVPGQIAAGPTLGDELYVGGRHRVAGALDGLARASLSSFEDAATGRSSTARQAEAGVRFSPEGFRLQGLLRLAESDVGFGEDARRTRRSAVLSADAPLGPFDVDGRVEVGRERFRTGSSGFRRLRGTVRWQGSEGWAWLTLGEEDGARVGSRRFLEAEGGWTLDRVELSGGASAESHGPGGLDVHAWSRVAYRVSGDLSVIGGVERDALGAGDGRWSVSLGVRQGLDLPLPMPESPVSHGVVFSDRDGDGERDPEEAGLEGVRLRKGFVEVTTDARGRFRIDQEAVRDQPLRVDAASLPGGAVVTPGADVPREGRAAIPVLRTARLEMSVFLDRDRDGRRDDGEGPVAGAVVRAVSREGGTRVVETDDRGRAAFSALRPGVYTIVLRVPATRRHLAVERELTVRLGPGGAESRRVPVTPEPRPVR